MRSPQPVLLLALGATWAFAGVTAAKLQRHSDTQGLSLTATSSRPRAVLSQLEELIRAKGNVGLTPAEKSFIQDIQELWKDEIMPGILQAINEGQNEITGLFEALLECDEHLGEEDAAIAELLEEIEATKDALETCVAKESKLLGKKDRLCKKVVDTKSTFVVALTPPVTGASNSARLEYLKEMNDFFCGADDEFKDQVKNCSEISKEHADKAKNCTELQNMLEASYCEWNRDHSHLCQSYDTCRRQALQRYNTAVTQVKAMEEEQQKDYEAAVRIECLWDAWDLATTPCLVDPEKVDECYEQPVDMTNVTITYPLVPDVHSCSMDSEGQTMTHGEEDVPCSDEFLSKQYGSLGVDDRTTLRMTESCRACAATAVAPDSSVPTTLPSSLSPRSEAAAVTTASPASPATTSPASAATASPAGLATTSCPEGSATLLSGYSEMMCLGSSMDFLRISVSLDECQAECASEPDCLFFTFRAGSSSRCAGCKTAPGSQGWQTQMAGFEAYHMCGRSDFAAAAAAVVTTTTTTSTTTTTTSEAAATTSSSSYCTWQNATYVETPIEDLWCISQGRFGSMAFLSPRKTFDECVEMCRSVPFCKFFNYGTSGSSAGWCNGCRRQGDWSPKTGMKTYEMCA